MRHPRVLKQLQRHLRRALATDPAAHSYSISPNRSRSLTFALAGCAYMLRHQKNVRIMAPATVAVLGLGLRLGIDAISWSVLILVIALGWIAEFINAAIEATVNLSVQSYHPLAKIAKDVAAGAVLLSAVTAAAIGLLVLGPPLIERLLSGIAVAQGCICASPESMKNYL